MMTIYLNGDAVLVRDSCFLSDFLLEKGYIDDCYAVALNRSFIPRANHAATLLQENDLIEIIVPMQGG